MTTQGTGITTISDQSSSRTDAFVELVAPKLQLVEEELHRNFASSVKTINDTGKHILDGGGKRLRPMLLLLASDLVGYTGDQDVVYAAIVEMIHTASLVHDDIIDEAAVRRGRTSLNYRWGNHLTVLVGDYWYSHAMDILLREGRLDIIRLLSAATVRMTEGEVMALEWIGKVDLTREEYFNVVGRKTSELFGATCRIPGHLADVSDEQKAALFDYGYSLGTCFQLVDDLLDFTSSAEVLGKPVLSDLREGKLTLPLILSLPRASEAERRKIEKVATERAFASVTPGEILDIVSRHDGLDQSREIARSYAVRARKALSLFPSSRAKDALDFALDFVLTRER